jgi:glycosyltransferase involved in cell wall biosynthesis
VGAVIRVFGWQTSTAAEHDFRIGLPFPLLDPERFEWTVGQPGPDIHDYDVVFAHRLAGRSDLWQRLCADPNVFCVYDMDDDLLCVDRENTACYRIFHPLEVETRRNVLAADIVTVSSPGLLERYSQIHPRVALLPQVIPDGMPDWPIPVRERPLTVGWAGSMHKRQDWPGIAETLAELARIVPDVRFRMYGGDYTGGILGARCEFVPFTNPTTYWRSLDLDIGLAPLVDTPFNRGKTVTKLIEYGARCIPTVASAVGQYTTWVEQGINGYLVNDPSEWLPFLLALTDRDLRRDMALAAWESSRPWVVSRHVDKWEAVFEGKIA